MYDWRGGVEGWLRDGSRKRGLVVGLCARVFRKDFHRRKFAVEIGRRRGVEGLVAVDARASPRGEMGLDHADHGSLRAGMDGVGASGGRGTREGNDAVVSGHTVHQISAERVSHLPV